MRKLSSAVLSFYSFILSAVITIGAPTQFLFYPVCLYLLFEILGKFWKINFFNKETFESFLSSFAYKTPFPLLKTLALYYSFVLTAIMVFAGFISTKNLSETISAFLFLPLALHFTLKVLPKRRKGIDLPEVILTPQSLKPEFTKPQFIKADNSFKKSGLDKDRRMFLKLIGSAGITVFMFSLFTKKAHAAFFGSVPGPGTVSIKDSLGTVIDPAKNHPTDGYKINQLDDSSPAYYGFVDKDGDWFIMKEDSGDYRYYKKQGGDGNFATEWPNRATLSPYGYFDAIF